MIELRGIMITIDEDEAHLLHRSSEQNALQILLSHIS